MTPVNAIPMRDEPPSLAPLVTMLAADMTQVNATILARMDSDIPLIPVSYTHLTLPTICSV